MEVIELQPTPEEAGSRVDVVLRAHTAFSRTRIAGLIAEGALTQGERQVCRPSEAVTGECLRLTVPEPQKSALAPQALPLNVLWQDADLAVVEKPCGMVVHPAAGNEDGTLVNALLYHLSGLSGIGGEERPGIVHRLDKDTSGLLVVAKNDFAHEALAAQFAGRTTEKHYRAAVWGAMKTESGQIDAPIGRHPTERKRMAVVPSGRPSQTEWTVLERFDGATLLDVHLLTGRTHQIRVHMQSIGHPVMGDGIYAPGRKGPVKIPRLMLHAYSLAFNHPRTGERMTFNAPMDAVLMDTLAKLRHGRTGRPTESAAQRKISV